jgi:hypothetical protein
MWQHARVSVCALAVAFFSSPAEASYDLVCAALKKTGLIAPSERVVLFARGIGVYDFILPEDRNWLGSLGAISDNYKGHNVRLVWAAFGERIRWAKPALSSSDERELKEAVAFLYQDTDRKIRSAAYLNYLEFKKRHTELVQKYQSNPAHIVLPAERQELQQAKDDLDTVGQRAKIEAQIAIIERMEAKSARPEKAAFENSVHAAQHPDAVPYTFVPKVEDAIASETGWSTVTVTLNSRQDVVPLESRNACVDNTFSYPIAGESAVDGRSIVAATRPVRADIALQTIEIRRPWLASAFLLARSWQLRDKQMLSNGAIDAPAGLLPVIPTKLILVGRVRYTSSDTQAVRRPVAELLQRRTLGMLVPPLVFAAPPDLGGMRSDFLRPSVSPGGVQTDFAQIVGVVLSAIPRSPNVDEKLQWDE